jgi:zinc protease
MSLPTLLLVMAAAFGPADTLPADPALARGVLPNGMHYYVRVNKAPTRRAELRLVVNAGSVLEDEDQRGLAHFLEHMAFNGTTHFPKHALLDYLQTAGMRFGADLNAETAYDETVYEFTVPTDEPQFLPQGLQMLADLAGGGITVDSSEVVAERGVVMGEWRTRLADTATQSAQAHQDSMLYGPESRYTSRSPIGLTSIISQAQPAPIKRFYKEWYRPDLMAVVVVGDVDKAAAVRLIRERFGSIPAVAHPTARPAHALPTSSVPAFDAYRNLEVFPQIRLFWKRPIEPVATRAAFRQQLVERLLFDGLTRRYLHLREQAGRPFFYAATGVASLAARGTEAALMQVVADPDSLAGGLASAMGELERIARYGVPAAALEPQKTALVRQYESAAAAEDAVPSAQYAAAYADDYLHGNAPLLSAAQELAIVRAVVPTITSADLARAAAFWHRRSDLLISVTLPTFAHVRPFTQETVLAILDSVAQTPLAADSAAALVDAPLMAQLPTPGRITGERQDEAAGVTEWTLSNGARVLFKPTRFNRDELLIKAVSPGGFSLVPDSLFFSPGRMVAEMMTEAAGVGTLDRQREEQKLASTVLREFNVSITNNDESISLGGSPKDLATLFQLLNLQFTAPKLDTPALAGWKQAGSAGNFSVDDQITYVLSRNDPRRAPPSPALMQFADVDRAMAVYRDRFGNAGDFTFLIVGSATAAQVRPLVERYVASLPSTGRHEVPRSIGVRPWSEVAQQQYRAFEIPKASTFLVFDGLFPSAPTEYLAQRRLLDALAWVLRLKLTDDLRERLGGTYGVNVQQLTYADPEEHYRVNFAFDAAPERMDTMLDALFGQLDTVRAAGATTAELTKVVAMQRRTREVALQDNHYWLGAIERFDRLKIPFGLIARPQDSTLTPDEIKGAAQRYLPNDSYLHVTVLPTDTTYMLHPGADTTSMAAPTRMARARETTHRR